MRNLIFAIVVASFMLLLSACSTDGKHQKPGSEYMPDMYHSIAYESNLEDYYEYNTWDSKKDYYDIAKPRKPVQGTIPRGYAGAGMEKHMDGTADLMAMSIPVNGSVPYYYEDTEEERARATAELINNPYPITNDGMEKAKVLYETFCGICHGNKGDGNGYLVDEANPNAVYPAQPASFLTDEFVAASNGRYYHAIMHGKNVMGGYADKISYEERWQVIHYIRGLQAKDKKLVYNEQENTLNEIDVPKDSPKYVAQYISYSDDRNDGNNYHDQYDSPEGEAHHDVNHEGHGSHGEDHSHGEVDVQMGDEDAKKKGFIPRTIDKVKDGLEKRKERRLEKKAEKNKGE